MTKRMRVTASTLNLRSLPGGMDIGDLARNDVLTALGQSFDSEWVFVATQENKTGWVAARYVEEIAAETVFVVPSGLAEIRAVYGEPGNPQCTAGTVNLPAPLPLSFRPTEKITRFACHVKAAPFFQAALNEIHETGLWGLLEDFGGCFNLRQKRGMDKISTHGWGIAIDLNVRSNPLGAPSKMDPRIVAVFERRGLVWGGRWKRVDAMHFQLARGY